MNFKPNTLRFKKYFSEYDEPSCDYIMRMYNMCDKYNLMYEKDLNVNEQRWDFQEYFETIKKTIDDYNNKKQEEQNRKMKQKGKVRR